MALVFFKQSDIEAMDINDIPEEFTINKMKKEGAAHE